MGAIYDKAMTGDFAAALCKSAWFGSHLSDDDIADMRSEFARPRRYHCSDGMCGADDCATCHPEIENEDSDQEPEPEQEPDDE